MTDTPAPVRIRRRVRGIIVWMLLLASVPLLYAVLLLNGGKTP